MNYPNHKTRRSYLTSSPYYKRIQKLSFNHPDRVEYRKITQEKGVEIFKENLETFQKQYVDRLAPLEAKTIERIKAKNLSTEEYNEYMELWAEANMWPGPKDISVKRRLKKLNKKYKV